MTFKIGMKVVCVDVSGWENHDYQAWSYPRLGDIGTITSLYTYAGVLCITLAEFPNRNTPKPGFYAYRFRPAVSPKQEVSFTTGADPDSERDDCRSAREKAWGCSA